MNTKPDERGLRVWNRSRRLSAIEHAPKHSAGADEGLRPRGLNLRVMADLEALEAGLELFGWIVDHDTNPKAPWEVIVQEALSLTEAQPLLERLMPALREGRGYEAEPSTRLSRVESKVPERCAACGSVPSREDVCTTGLMYEYEGVRMTGDGTPVPPDDLKACVSCGRARRYCNKVIVGIQPMLL